MNNVPPSCWLKRLAPPKARRQRHLPPRGAQIVDCPSRTGRGKLHHRQRIVKLLSPVGELRNDFRI